MRVSQNHIFNDPEAYCGLKNFTRIYVSENLSNQIRDFFLKNTKNRDTLIKMARDLGYKQQNLCITSFDGMTALTEITPTKMGTLFWINYRNPAPVMFSIENTDERPTLVSPANREISNIITGYQLFLYFILFVDIERKEIKPKEKYKPAKYLPVKNDTKRPFIVADINWNYDIDINAPFSVSGHYRLQRYGPEWSRARLIYIQPFQKEGYHREAGKNKLDGRDR